MPSASAQKLVRKLQQRKYRWQERKFIAEGPKVVADLLESGLKAQFIWSTESFPGAEIASEKELAKLSHFSTFNQVLAVFDFPQFQKGKEGPVLILDRINDPGNLGTLIRTADWFGFSAVYCLNGTADVFNPKTVQSTMGSLARVPIIYGEAEEVYAELEQSHSFYCADMDGDNPKSIDPAPSFALVMGSESHGPDTFWRDKSTVITIPKIGQSSIDSLNVAVSGGILMGQLSGAAL